MSTLIAPEELGGAYLRLDARMGPDAHEAYREAHLEGAHFVDVELDLTGDASDPAKGGRHPLPPLKRWCETLGKLGVDPETKVVVYDDANGAKAAARAWWMLRAVGHRHVWVLDGGLQGAIDAGLRLIPDVPTRLPKGAYPASAWTRPTVTLEEVEARLAAARGCLVDVRAAERYEGREEPYDPEPGHIPGAINVPLTRNLDERGRFARRGALRALYTDALGDAAIEDVVVSCGSGITACHTLLALEHAGFERASLYVGSYSEWSRSGRPIERP